jgi:hypothetical protein
MLARRQGVFFEELGVHQAGGFYDQKRTAWAYPGPKLVHHGPGIGDYRQKAGRADDVEGPGGKLVQLPLVKSGRIG